MHVQDIMTKPVHSCRFHESLEVAAKLMWEHDCGALPVVANDDTLLGIITDRDICMAAYTRGRPLTEISIEPAMAKEVFSCAPDEDLATVVDLMRAKRIRRVPVVDREGRPIGMLAQSDLVRAVANEDMKRSGLSRDDLIQAIALISEPRSSVTA